MTDAEQPERHADALSFEAVLEDALRQAAELSGEFTLEGSGMSAGVGYVEPGSSEVDFVTGFRHLDPDYPGQPTHTYLSAHSNELIEKAKQGLIARRQAFALIHVLKQPDLQPADLGMGVEYAFRLMPSMAAAEEVHHHNYPSYVAEVLTRRALDMEPEAAAETFTLFVNLYNQYTAQTGGEGETWRAQRLIDLMSGVLTRSMTEGAETLTRRHRPEEWRYDLSGNYDAVHNASTALDIMDEAGLIDISFWKKLLNIPLETQSMEVVDLLTRRLGGDRGAEMIAESKMGRVQLLENIVSSAWARAAGHAARDRKNFAGIDTVVRDAEHDSRIVGLRKLIHIANSVMGMAYPDAYTSLRTGSSFADAAPALSFLLRATLRPNASEEEKAQANEEAARYVLLIETVFQQAPVVKTIGDLALRYPNATQEELDALNAVLIKDGPGPADALWHREFRDQRRDKVHKPGYGLLS